MRALVWRAPGQLAVERVPDPIIANAGDVIVRVRLSLVCGSDLHLLDGDFPSMQPGDVLGQEFVGDVVEVGPAVRRHSVGDRVVVCSVISCGRCWYCRHGLLAACDNSNPEPELAELAWGAAPAGFDGALLYAYTLLQPATAARVRAAFPILGSPAGLAAEATVCAMLLQTVERGDNLVLTDPLQQWATALRHRAGA